MVDIAEHRNNWDELSRSLRGVDFTKQQNTREWKPEEIDIYIPNNIELNLLKEADSLVRLGALFDSHPGQAFSVLATWVLLEKRPDGLNLRHHAEAIIAKLKFKAQVAQNPMNTGTGTNEGSGSTTGTIPSSTPRSQSGSNGAEEPTGTWEAWFKIVSERKEPGAYLAALDGLFCTLTLLFKYERVKLMAYITDKLSQIATSRGCMDLAKIPTTIHTFAEIKGVLIAGSQLASQVYITLMAGFYHQQTSHIYHPMGTLRLAGYGTITVQLCIQACLSLGITISEYFENIVCNPLYNSALAVQKYLVILNDNSKDECWKMAVMLGRLLSDGYFNNLAFNNHQKFNYLSICVLRSGGQSVAGITEAHLGAEDKETLEHLADLLHANFSSLGASSVQAPLVEKAVQRSRDQSMKHLEVLIKDPNIKLGDSPADANRYS